MAAKVAGSWAVTEPAGIEALTTIGTTQLHKLGRRCKAVDTGSTAYGLGEFIYLLGVTSTVRGSLVLIKDDFSTSLAAARAKGGLAVALAANVGSSYGWYQILGQGVVACGTTGSVVANTPLFISATSGEVDDAVVAGDQIIGMRAVTADDTNTLVACMATYPAAADFDNA